MGGKWSSMDPSEIEVPELETLLARDPYLKHYENDIRRRFDISIFFSYSLIKVKLISTSLL